MDLERLVVRLTADAAQYNRVMDAAESRLSRFARTVMPFGALMEVPFIAAAGAVTALGVSMGYATVEALRLTAGFERANIAMEVMTGSATTAKEIMTEILQMGIETPFKSSELLSAGQVLKGYNVANEDLVDTLKVLGSVAQGDADKLNRIARAYGQVKSAGRLMGQEMLQFINASAISVEDLGKVMNVHPSRVKTMIEEAKVSFGTVVKAFNMVTGEGGRFFNILEKVNKTVPGQWSALTETMQLGLIRIGEGFFKAFEIASTLSKWANNLRTHEGQFDSFFQKARQLFDNVVRVVKLVVFWFEKAVASVQAWAKENPAFIESLERIAKVILAIAVAWGIWTVAVTAFYAVFSPLTMAILTFASALFLLDQIGTFDEFGKGFAEAINEVEADFVRLTKNIKMAFVAGDWQAVGELIGVGMKIGLLTVWHGVIVEMKTALIDFTKWWMRTLGTTAFSALDLPTTFAESFIFPEVDATRRANERSAMFLDKFISPLERKAEGKKATILEEQMESLNRDLAPHRLRLAEIEKRLIVKAHDEVMEKWMRANADMLEAQQRFADEIHGEQAMSERKYIAVLEALFGKQRTWTEGQTNLLLQWRRESQKTVEVQIAATDAAIAGVFGGAKAVAPLLGPGDKRVSVREPVEFRPETLQYVARLTREMERGQWAGEATDKLGLFFRNLDLIDEAFRGPLRNQLEGFMAIGGGMAGVALNARVPPLIGEKERDFALFQEFSNLRQAVGQREMKLPTAVMEGTTEARDVINRATMRQATVQEQVRNILEEAKEIQKQQRDYMKQVVDELKKIRESDFRSPEDFGGGGDF